MRENDKSRYNHIWSGELLLVLRYIYIRVAVHAPLIRFAALPFCPRFQRIFRCTHSLK